MLATQKERYQGKKGKTNNRKGGTLSPQKQLWGLDIYHCLHSSLNFDRQLCSITDFQGFFSLISVL